MNFFLYDVTTAWGVWFTFFYQNRALLNDMIKCRLVFMRAMKLDESAVTGNKSGAWQRMLMTAKLWAHLGDEEWGSKGNPRLWKSGTVCTSLLFHITELTCHWLPHQTPNAACALIQKGYSYVLVFLVQYLSEGDTVVNQSKYLVFP